MTIAPASTVPADMRKAYEKGYAHGHGWVGPNADGSMGSLSPAFVREFAETFAAGHRFAEFTDGPTSEEQDIANEYMRAFWIGRADAQ